MSAVGVNSRPGTNIAPEPTVAIQFIQVSKERMQHVHAASKCSKNSRPIPQLFLATPRYEIRRRGGSDVFAIIALKGQDAGYRIEPFQGGCNPSSMKFR